MSKKIFKFSLILVVVTILVSGCSLPWKKKVPVVDNTQINQDINQTSEDATSTSEVAGTKQIKKFASYNDLKIFLEENNNNQNFSSALSRNGMGEGMMVKSLAPMANGLSAASESSAVSSDASTGQSSDYSSTNNQVNGVDEADIIKTDGTYVYALVRNELKIIKVNPVSEAKVISTITFKSRPEDIFINGTSLAVFGSDQQIFAMEMYRNFRRQNPYTFFKVFDLSNPDDPKLVRDLNFEGSYSDARMVGDYAYLFTNSSANYIESEPLTPRVLNNGEVLPSSCDSGSKCFAPDVYYFDIPYDSYNFANVTAINLKDNNEDIAGQAYLMNYGQNFYVSKDNIYITYTETLNEYDLEQTVKKDIIITKLSDEEKNKISKIDAVDSFILSKSEKKFKVASIIDRYFSSLSEEDQKTLQINLDDALKQKLTEQSADMEKTIIHKIAINGLSVAYRGMGEVSGQVLNQFSMDENGDYFRIATTRSPIWSRLSSEPEKSYSNVYVLNNELKVVGNLAENLATNEKIYSARFMGDRVYLVTFKQTDPLYVISLTDPMSPSVLGAIKVPGFSTYLHPADTNGNQLIGFGRDTEEDSSGAVKIKGLKMSLFDFTDLQNPQELDSYVIGNSESDSIALQDHKAFLYSQGKNLLSIPAIFRDNGKISFAGSLVFNIVSNKFVLKGKIDHSDGGIFSNSDYWGGYNYYDNTVKRSLYIDNNFFTFSNKFLKINSLSDLSAIKKLILTGTEADYIVTPTPTPAPSDPAPAPDSSSAPMPTPTPAPDAVQGSSAPALGQEPLNIQP